MRLTRVPPTPGLRQHSRRPRRRGSSTRRRWVSGFGNVGSNLFGWWNQAASAPVGIGGVECRWARCTNVGSGARPTTPACCRSGRRRCCRAFGNVGHQPSGVSAVDRVEPDPHPQHRGWRMRAISTSGPATDNGAAELAQNLGLARRHCNPASPTSATGNGRLRYLGSPCRRPARATGSAMPAAPPWFRQIRAQHRWATGTGKYRTGLVGDTSLASGACWCRPSACSTRHRQHRVLSTPGPGNSAR